MITETIQKAVLDKRIKNPSDQPANKGVIQDNLNDSKRNVRGSDGLTSTPKEQTSLDSIISSGRSSLSSADSLTNARAFVPSLRNLSDDQVFKIIGDAERKPATESNLAFLNDLRGEGARATGEASIPEQRMTAKAQTSSTSQLPANNQIKPTATQTNTTEKVKPFTVTSTMKNNMQNGLNGESDGLKAAFDESNNIIKEGLDKYTSILDGILGSTQEKSLQSIEMINNSFQQSDSLLESGIDDLMASNKELEKSILEGRGIEVEGELLGRSSGIKAIESALDESRDTFDEAIQGQQQSIEDQRVRDETFAGLRGNFGSSASLENIDKAEQQGRSILASLQKAKARSGETFAQQLIDVEDSYTQNLKTINNTVNTKLSEIKNTASSQFLSIQKDRTLNETQRVQAMQDVINRFTDQQTSLGNATAKAVFDTNNAVAQNVLDYKKEEFARQQETAQLGLDERKVEVQEAGVGFEGDRIDIAKQELELSQDKFLQDVTNAENKNAFEAQQFEYQKQLDNFQIDSQIKAAAIAERKMVLQEKEFDQMSGAEQTELQQLELEEARLSNEALKMKVSESKLEQQLGETGKFSPQWYQTDKGKVALGQEDALRKELTNNSGEFIDVNDSFDRILASSEDPTAAGDLAIIFNYMKMLDPTSTVREGEFATAAKAGSLGDKIIGQYNGLINGKRLSGDVRVDFVDRAYKLFGKQVETQQVRNDSYIDLSNKRGVNPENVVLDFLEATSISDEALKTALENANTTDEEPNFKGFLFDEKTSRSSLKDDENLSENSFY